MAGLILLQSCSPYKNTVTLEQAAKQEKAVKIITVDDFVLQKRLAKIPVFVFWQKGSRILTLLQKN